MLTELGGWVETELNHSQEMEVHRLGQELRRARPHGHHGVVERRVAGEHDHREQRPALPHERGELEAVRPGHQVDVGDHDVDVLGGEHGQRGIGARGVEHPRAREPAQHQPRVGGDLGVVLDQQHDALPTVVRDTQLLRHEDGECRVRPPQPGMRNGRSPGEVVHQDAAVTLLG